MMAIRRAAVRSFCGRLVSQALMPSIERKLLIEPSSDVESEPEPEPEPDSFWYIPPTIPLDGLESQPLKLQKPRVAVEAISLPMFERNRPYTLLVD